MSPTSSVAAQVVEVGQEIAVITSVGTTSVELQLGVTALGSPDQSAPFSSPRRQSVLLAQLMAVTSWAPANDCFVQVGEADPGFALLATSPFNPPVTQESVVQDTDVSDCPANVVSDQVVGVVGSPATMLPFMSTATQSDGDGQLTPTSD